MPIFQLGHVSPHKEISVGPEHEMNKEDVFPDEILVLSFHLVVNKLHLQDTVCRVKTKVNVKKPFDLKVGFYIACIQRKS